MSTDRSEIPVEQESGHTSPKGREPVQSPVVPNTPVNPAVSLLSAAVATDLLHHSASQWVRLISWGAALLALAVFIHLGAGAWAWETRSETVAMWARILHIAAAAMIAGGLWIVTIREGKQIAKPQRRALAGMLAQWAAVLVFLFFVAGMVLHLLHQPMVAQQMLMLTFLVMAFEAACGALFLSTLAVRIPHDGLAGQFANIAWIMPLALVLAACEQYFDLAEYISSMFFVGYPVLGALAGLLAWVAVTHLRLAIHLRRTVKLSTGHSHPPGGYQMSSTTFPAGSST